ncbi:MAG: class I SAM-dependent methyltransferase family protein [Actinomycetota bacterium]|nr:class I SAM-dependent methyltransferase family protein [Actinomycetota bacterium]
MLTNSEGTIQDVPTQRSCREVLDLPDPADVGADAPRYNKIVQALRATTMAAIAAGRPNPNVLLDPAVSPRTPAWMALRKHAIALHPLYSAPHMETWGAGLTVEELDEPLVPGGGNPFDLLALHIGPHRAVRVRDRYAALLSQPYDQDSRMSVGYMLDARAIRWRAQAATLLAREVARTWSGPESLTLISLACGAAGPVAQLADGLAADGHELEELHLVDRDPVALAAGRAIARQHVDSDKVRVTLLDLVDITDGTATELEPHLGRQRAHVVDILGLFEYLPDNTAVDLLRQARELVRAEGVVLLANMLDDRPQQDFFEHVVQWPALVQRSVDDLDRLLTEAGFDLLRAKTVTASRDEAVYAVCAARP